MRYPDTLPQRDARRRPARHRSPVCRFGHLKVAPGSKGDSSTLIVFSYLAIFAYMITQSTGMAERSSQQAQLAREELRRVVGFSVADEIEKLDRLKKSGSITEQEFARLRAKLIS
jgi:Short C-terminal domain